MDDLNEFLNAKDCLNTQEDSTNSFQFDVNTERSTVGNVQLRNASISNAKMGTAVIGTANIGTLSFNEIYGGTATLGGTANGNGRLVMKNQSGNTIMVLDASGLNGTNSGSINQNGTFIASGVFSQRHYVTVLAAGASGGAPTSFYTDAQTPQGLDTSRFSLDPNSFPANKFYLEAVYRCGTTGETARTMFMDFYDITGGTPVALGTFTGTSQATSGFGLYPRERSIFDFRPSLIGGTRDYMLRYWGTYSGTASQFVDLYAARIIIDF